MRIQEASTLAVDPTTKALRVCLIREGSGSSADYLSEFFNESNAKALAGVLSFPNHPHDINKPEHRDPLSAIGIIGENVTIETDPETGKRAFWSDYDVPDAKVREYLQKFGPKLGLSIYADSTGHEDPQSGKWIAESIRADDPYRSVDLVVAAGAGGKFDRIAEGLIRVVEASAHAGENEDNMEIKDVEKVVADALAPVLKTVEGLASALEGKAKADLQIAADDEAVNTRVKEFTANYDKAIDAINVAKITESQKKSLRAKALAGEDITDGITEAEAIVAEARAAVEDDDTDLDAPIRVVENHNPSSNTDNKKALDINVGGFGKA